MAEVKPYNLKQAQDLVRQSMTRSEDRHKLWRALEVLYRTGDIDKARSQSAAQGSFLQTIDTDVVNLILPHANVILASVIAHDPRLMAVPYGGGDEAESSAKVIEAVIRYFWLRTDATRDLKDATWDMVVLGNGFLKVGWQFQETVVQEDATQLQEQFTDLVESDQLLAEVEGGDPDGPDALVDRLQLAHSVVEVDEPYVEYVSPYDIFVPPNARRMYETRWVAQRITLPLDELEANDLFKGDIKADAGGGGGDEQIAEWARKASDEAAMEGGAEGANQTATIIEFYDMRARQLMVFQLDGDKELYSGPIPYAHRYPPFAHLRNYNPNGTEFWAFGDLEAVAAIQGNFNEFLTEQLDNARRAGNKYLVAEEAATSELMSALTSNQGDVIAKVNTGGLPLAEVVQAVERKALSGDVYAVKADLEDYLRKVLGINDFQAGGVGADRMSATAAAVVDGLATLRAQEKVAQVEDGAAQVGKLIALLCQEFLDRDTPVRVAGANGAAWPTVNAEMLRGEFIVSVEGGSMKAVNPATREQKGMRTLTEVVPVLMQMGYDPTAALRHGLRDLGYDPDVLLQAPAAPAEDPALAEDPAAMPEGAPADVGSGDPTALLAQAEGGLAL